MGQGLTSEWGDIWCDFIEGFNQAMDNNNTEGAWAVLSQAAERYLGATEHTRHVPQCPKAEESVQSTKAPSFQTLPERQLRRLARRAQQLQLEPNNRQLRRNLDNLVKELCPKISSTCQL